VGVSLTNFNKSGYPPFVVDYYTNVKKMTTILVKPPKLGGSKLTIRFGDKTRDQFRTQLVEALKGQAWLKPFKTEETIA